MACEDLRLLHFFHVPAFPDRFPHPFFPFSTFASASLEDASPEIERLEGREVEEGFSYFP